MIELYLRALVYLRGAVFNYLIAEINSPLNSDSCVPIWHQFQIPNSITGHSQICTVRQLFEVGWWHAMLALHICTSQYIAEKSASNQYVHGKVRSPPHDMLLDGRLPPLFHVSAAFREHSYRSVSPDRRTSPSSTKKIGESDFGTSFNMNQFALLYTSPSFHLTS
jgi:hypothetical protein